MKRRKSQPEAEPMEVEAVEEANGSATVAPASTSEPKLKIHRCRFMQWEPSPVVAMASSRSGYLLAVARENGVVEVRLTRQKFRVVSCIEAAAEGMIRCLAWSRQAGDTIARLFVGCIDGTITEVDFWRMEVKQRRDSYGGAVWSMASAHYRDSLAVACEDGAVKLFSTADGELEYSRSLPSIHSRSLSLAWTGDDSGLFVGGADGTIRHFDVATGQSAYRMTLQSRGPIKPALVWCLKALPDGTLVSGDSLGNVHIWDGNMGTLEQTFSVHEAAVLTVEASKGGDLIFASGVDSKLLCLKRLVAPVPPSSAHHYGRAEAPATVEATRWVQAASNRAHSHDVLALAIVEHLSRKGTLHPVLVSGGKDTKICTYSVPDFATTRPRYISPYPYQRVGHYGDETADRLLLLRHDRKLQLWKLQKDASHFLQDPSPDLEIPAVHNGFVTAAGLAPNGRYLAYATAGDVRVYRLGEGKKPLLPKRHPLELPAKKNVTCLCFSPDSCKLVLGYGCGRVVVVGLEDGKVAELEAKEQVGDEDEDEETEERRGTGVVGLSVSADGRLLAVTRLSSRVDVLSIGSSGKVKLKWSLPSLDSPITTVAYHATAPDVLVVACVSNRFYLFDKEGSLKDWSRELGHRLPPAILDRADVVVGIAFDPAAPQTLFFYGFGFMYYVDLEKPHSKVPKIMPETHPQAQQQQKDLRKDKLNKERRKVRAAAKAAKDAALLQDGTKKRGDGDEEEEAEPAVNGLATHKEVDGQKGHKKLKTNKAADEQVGGVTEQVLGTSGSDSRSSWNFLLHLGYQGLITVTGMGPHEMLVIEEPWIKIVNRLPEVLYRHRYGT